MPLWKPWQATEEPQVTVGITATSTRVPVLQIKEGTGVYFAVPASCQRTVNTRDVHKRPSAGFRLLLCALGFSRTLPRPDQTAENSAGSGSVHRSLSTSWLCSLHLSSKHSNTNRVLMCLEGIQFVRLLFFQVREELNCIGIFGSRHSWIP